MDLLLLHKRVRMNISIQKLIKKHILIVILLLISCKQSYTNKTWPIKPAPKSYKKLNPKAVSRFEAYCFYKFDEKYATKQNKTINEWLKIKSTMIINASIKRNLFDTDGGGLYGCESNPDNDLYIAILHDSNIQKKNVLLNNKVVADSVFSYRNIDWFKIKKKVWKKESTSANLAKIIAINPDYFDVPSDSIYLKLDHKTLKSTAADVLLEINIDYGTSNYTTKYFCASYVE